MEKIATDTYSFERLRQGGFAYVDKTDILLPLVDVSIGFQFFIARPRRFGKSLAISTLHCLFEGRRDLFQGLAIEPKWDWSKRWPVLHLDMGSCQANSVDAFWDALRIEMYNEAMRLGVPLHTEERIPGAFNLLIHDLAAKSPDGKIVLLIDEYDKPLLGRLGHPDVNEIRDALKSFYSVIKTCEGLQRFALMTGVSKFAKVSIFSDLNNLNDMTMDARIATLFGYTHDEVKANFLESLKSLGENYGWSVSETFDQLVKQYDGYCFEENGVRVFNPVSLGKCLASHKFGAYWFETGTPTFLMELLKASPTEVDGVTVDQDVFSAYEPSAPEILPLLYQTGYLTIRSAQRCGVQTSYTLGFPNEEVRTAFSKAVSRSFSNLSLGEHAALLQQIVQALRDDDVNDMLDALSCFFANIPANITAKLERYYQSLFYAVFILIGARIQAECWTNRGRVDAVIETEGGIYVFEFKLNGTADEAIAQIREKGYHQRYLRQGKPITLVGVAFDAEKRNLSDRKIEAV